MPIITQNNVKNYIPKFKLASVLLNAFISNC